MSDDLSGDMLAPSWPNLVIYLFCELEEVLDFIALRITSSHIIDLVGVSQVLWNVVSL